MTALEETISGQPYVGSLLTATSGSWTPSGVTLLYLWYANGVPVSYVNSPKYRIVHSDLNKTITVKVTASSGGDHVTVASNGIVVRTGTIGVVKKPSLSGKAKVGQKVKLFRGTFTPDDAKTRVRWFLDGQPLKQFSRTSLTVLQAYVGHKITAQVTVFRDGYSTPNVITKAKKVK